MPQTGYAGYGTTHYGSAQWGLSRQPGRTKKPRTAKSYSRGGNARPDYSHLAMQRGGSMSPNTYGHYTQPFGAAAQGQGAYEMAQKRALDDWNFRVNRYGLENELKRTGGVNPTDYWLPWDQIQQQYVQQHQAQQDWQNQVAQFQPPPSQGQGSGYQPKGQHAALDYAYQQSIGQLPQLPSLPAMPSLPGQGTGGPPPSTGGGGTSQGSPFAPFSNVNVGFQPGPVYNQAQGQAAIGQALGAIPTGQPGALGLITQGLQNRVGVDLNSMISQANANQNLASQVAAANAGAQGAQMGADIYGMNAGFNQGMFNTLLNLLGGLVR